MSNRPVLELPKHVQRQREIEEKEEQRAQAIRQARIRSLASAFLKAHAAFYAEPITSCLVEAAAETLVDQLAERTLSPMQVMELYTRWLQESGPKALAALMVELREIHEGGEAPAEPATTPETGAPPAEAAAAPEAASAG